MKIHKNDLAVLFLGVACVVHAQSTKAVEYHVPLSGVFANPTNSWKGGANFEKGERTLSYNVYWLNPATITDGGFYLRSDSPVLEINIFGGTLYHFAPYLPLGDLPVIIDGVPLDAIPPPPPNGHAGGSGVYGTLALTEKQEADLFSGQWFIQLNGADYPAALYGDIPAVPEPASFWLICMCGGLWLVTRVVSKLAR